MNYTPEQIKQAKKNLIEMLYEQHKTFCKEENCDQCKKFEKLLDEYK